MQERKRTSTCEALPQEHSTFLPMRLIFFWWFAISLGIFRNYYIYLSWGQREFQHLIIIFWSNRSINSRAI